MVLVEDLRFCQFLVLYKIHQEKLVGYIFVKQQAFLDNGNMDVRKQQNSHFSKGNDYDFGQKNIFFSSLAFIKSRSRKSVCWRSRSFSRILEHLFIKNAICAFFKNG